MKTIFTVIEVKRGDKVSYVGPYCRGQRIRLADDINNAGNFTGVEDLIPVAVSHLCFPDSTYCAFSAPSVDSAEVVRIELIRTEIDRKPAR